MVNNAAVLISGAGIAGPALALWLSRRGFRCTVVERAPALRDGGYAVDFRGDVHLEVLSRMGILDEVLAASTRMGDVSCVNGRSQPLARLPADVLSGDIEILRGDLAHILYEATCHKAEYLWGDDIASLSQDAAGVDVTFERGKARRFDFVVGADGLHSRVRALAFGEESRFLRYLGYYVSIFTLDNYLGLDHSGLFYNTPGKLAGIYSARHNAEAKAMFYFASPELDYDPRDTGAQRKILADTYRGVSWEVPRLLQSSEHAPDFYFDSVSQVHVDRWSKGRVVLLGDAGYCASPLSGMGTGLAIVGAYVLAGELAAAGADPAGAFERYQARMRGYVRECQESASGKWFIPSSRAAIWFRNQNLRLLPHLPWKGLIGKMARKTATAIDLPNYAA
jgi:2-polyprenyl-6-methoxyphenol hydroxylase-like FAD-dependent oxidoreductase